MSLMDTFVTLPAMADLSAIDCGTAAAFGILIRYGITLGGELSEHVMIGRAPDAPAPSTQPQIFVKTGT